jgi:hypothetical protein
MRGSRNSADTRQGMVHVRPHGRFAAPDHLGDLGIGQAVPVPQHQHGPLLIGQACDSGCDPLGRFRLDRHLGRRRIAAGNGHRFRGVHRNQGQRPGLAERLATPVGGDGEQPAAETAREAVGPPLVPYRQERVLKQILGPVRIPDHPLKIR